MGSLRLVEIPSVPRFAPGTVTGVAIYPHWEAGEEDWSTYRRLWLGEE